MRTGQQKNKCATSVGHLVTVVPHHFVSVGVGSVMIYAISTQKVLETLEIGFIFKKCKFVQYFFQSRSITLTGFV